MWPRDKRHSRRLLAGPPDDVDTHREQEKQREGESLPSEGEVFGRLRSQPSAERRADDHDADLAAARLVHLMHLRHLLAAQDAYLYEVDGANAECRDAGSLAQLARAASSIGENGEHGKGSDGESHLERWPVAQLCEQNAKDAAGADKSLGRGRRQHVDQARRRARPGRRVGFQGPATSSHHRQGWGGGSWRRGKIVMLRHRLWTKWLLLLRWRLQRLQQIVRWRRWRQLLLWRRLWRRLQRVKTKDASQQLGHVPVGIAAQWPLPLRRCQRLRRVHAKTAAVHSAKRQDGRHALANRKRQHPFDPAIHCILARRGTGSSDGACRLASDGRALRRRPFSILRAAPRAVG
mmetsp:Transcript_8653/g.25284  ORF Transcript_8653/g.25284 Transcript_8653/m.25284 type:complete len:349 (-) Transcript_8653:931-1977(-)